MGVVRVTWPVFLNFALNHIFGIGEDKHFKFRLLIATQEYKRMHDIILLPKWMSNVSHDLFKFLGNKW